MNNTFYSLAPYYLSPFPFTLCLSGLSLEMSSVLRGAVMVECVRVQMLKGVFRLLTAKVNGSSNEVSIVDLFSHLTDMREDQKLQLNTHSTIEARSERQVTLDTYCNDSLDQRWFVCFNQPWLHDISGYVHLCLQNVEQRRLEALHRREELHFVISEEIEEAALTGGTHMANELLHKYYSCQVS